MHRVPKANGLGSIPGKKSRKFRRRVDYYVRIKNPISILFAFDYTGNAKTVAFILFRCEINTCVT